MDTNDIPQAGLMFQSFVETTRWFQWVVYLIGVGIALWGYFRSRKCGYLVFAVYFAFVVLWFGVWQPIHRSIHAHDPPNISAQTEQKIEEAQRQAADKLLAEAEHPPMTFRQRIYFPFGPIALVIGLWLLARRETPPSKPDANS
jgi:hypothetical protein